MEENKPMDPVEIEKKEVNSTKKAKLRVSYSKYGYMFIAPFFIVFLIFQLYPVLYTIFLSFTDASTFGTDYEFVGFQNYINIFKPVVGQTSFFIVAFLNTIKIWLIGFVPQILLALFLAAVFTDIKLKIRFQGFFKTFTYLPNIITVASIAILFQSMFDLHGPVNVLLQDWGILDEPYNFFIYKLPTQLLVSFIGFWMWYGYSFIILGAAIMSINPSLYEAAMVDGANSRQMFFRITLPLIKPILLFALVTSFVGGMQTFDIPFLLTNHAGSPDNAILTVALYIYNQAFTGGYNVYIASTASVLMLLFIAGVSALMFKSFRIGGSK